MFHTRNIPSFLFAIIICLYLDEAFPNHGAKERIFGQKRTPKKAKNSKIEHLFWVSSGCGSRWL